MALITGRLSGETILVVTVYNIVHLPPTSWIWVPAFTSPKTARHQTSLANSAFRKPVVSLVYQKAQHGIVIFGALHSPTCDVPTQTDPGKTTNVSLMIGCISLGLTLGGV